MYPWPLPEGHAYGPSVKHHDGKPLLEGIALAATQRRLREHWGLSVHVSTRYDGQTQRAVEEVQKTAGLDPTGVLDREVWELIWK